MKVIIKIELLPTEIQKEILFQTMEVFNQVCNYISERVFESKVFNQVKLHHFIYKEAREKFNIPSQYIVRAIAKVASCYKNNKRILHKFSKWSTVCVDARLLSFKNLSVASLNTVEGRQRIFFVFKGYMSLKVNRMLGEADLVYRSGKFFLHVVIELPEWKQ